MKFLCANVYIIIALKIFVQYAQRSLFYSVITPSTFLLSASLSVREEAGTRVLSDRYYVEVNMGNDYNFIWTHLCLIRFNDQRFPRNVIIVYLNCF